MLNDYILSHISPEHPYLYKLYRATNTQLIRPRMASGHLQGQLLKMLGVETKWHCDNHWLMTLRRKTSKGTAIFVSNLGSSAQHAQASYMNVKFNLELAPMEVRFLEC